MSDLLSICLYTTTESLARSLQTLLGSTRFSLQPFDQADVFLDYIQQHCAAIDCLIIQNIEAELAILNHLYEEGILLPVVIIEPQPSENTNPATPSPTFAAPDAANYRYHTGEISLLVNQLDEMPTVIDRAIANFLKLAPNTETLAMSSPENTAPELKDRLIQQQKRLSEKLKERLGYLGIYYKRNPNDFYRNLSPQERATLLKSIRTDYRDIILNYFLADYPLNDQIDQLVNQAFFADLSVSQILEIHMELIDDFAQQLKLEGRNEDILLDYRLALIDIIAHLCEMYRRSIPREDIPFEVFSSNE